MGLRKFGKKLEANTKKGMGAISPLTGIAQMGGSDGPDNPFGVPDLSYLREPIKYENFVGDVNRTISGLGLDVPSSVDQVKSQTEQEYLNTLLRGIGRDTDSAVGKAKGSFYSRGLFEPGAGVSSDIASVGLGQVLGQGQEKSEDARLKYALSDLDRLAAREDYSRRLKGSLVSGSADRQSGRDTAYAGNISGLYSAAEERKQKGKKGSYLDSFLRNFSTSAGSSAGEAAVAFVA